MRIAKQFSRFGAYFLHGHLQFSYETQREWKLVLKQKECFRSIALWMTKTQRNNLLQNLPQFINILIPTPMRTQSDSYFKAWFLCSPKIRLINLKGTFSVLAGSCWRTKNCLHFFRGPFLIQPIILFLFLFSFLLLEWIWLENAVGEIWACQLSPKNLPKTLVGCTFMRHNSWLCASQLPVVRAQVGKKTSW